ncbi:MAG TPA: OmpA family protein [Gemmatimonadaceae bacterium]
MFFIRNLGSIDTREARRFARSLLLVVVAAAAACAKVPPEAPAPAGDLNVKGAAEQIASDFQKQLGATTTRTIVIDPVRDRASGQQTGVSVRVETDLGPALSAIKGITLLPFDSTGASKARYIVTGLVSPGEQADSYTLTVALSDRQSGLVVAQSAARFVEAGLDSKPTRFFAESPVLVRDRSNEGYTKTTETPAGRAADPLYISQVETSALLAEALAAYNAENWDKALASYTAVSKRTDGQQLRTFNGLYLTNIRLGRTAGAEAAFAKIAQLGLETNNLAVKLLFRAGSATDFWPGRDYADVYPIWIRQLARAMQASGSCLNVVGHTSRSGSEAVNDRLSLQRAETVKRLLETSVRTLAARLKASGVGYRENIIGTGSDDERDAIDRRVEFKVVDCPR